jgi:hypothetical protein
MKRQYLFPAFILFSFQLFSQIAPVHSCAYHWCSGAGIEQTQFEMAFSPDGQSPVSDLRDAFSFENGCVDVSVPGGLSASATVRITPSKDGNPLEGITTYELPLIMQRMQSHIDGTEPFTEIWQWFAADVNGDGVVTEADINALHNLVLGIENELPAGGTWRFVPKSFVFANPANPLQGFVPVDISKNINDLNASEDFWGVQLGRVLTGTSCAVTGTATPPAFSTSKAWPNPTTGHFSVQMNVQESAELRGEVYDQTGRLVAALTTRSFPAGTATFEFDADGTAGVYFWKITDGEGRYSTGKVERR